MKEAYFGELTIFPLFFRVVVLVSLYRKSEEEGVHILKTSLCLLLKKYCQTGNVVDRPRARGPKKLTSAHYVCTDSRDDELTIRKFHYFWLRNLPSFMRLSIP